MKIYPILIGAGAFVLLAALVGCVKKSADKAHQDPTTSQTTVKHPDWSRDAVIYEVNLRQYSDNGKVTSFAEQLPRLKDLGVDILWFMPIHPISEKNRKGPLGSYYAVKDYKGFNPEFGTINQFKDVVNQAHQMGMKVIIDWVPNHTGCDNSWVTEHPDWYEKNDKGEMFGPGDWTDVYKLDYSNPEMRDAMVDAMKYWLTEVDIDGFRQDVAGAVPTDFWNDTRKELEQVKPIFMLAEASNADLLENAFDAGYNWPMKDLFSAIAATSGQYTFQPEGEPMRTFPAKTAVDIDTLLAQQAAQFPGDSFLMNMTTNHDLNSWEGTEFERLGNLQGAFAVLMYTLPGMPLIYTGQETGMNRAFKFFEKDQAPQWEPRNEYFNFYQTLNQLKHSQPALRAGDQGGEMVRYATTNPNVYAFSRTKGEKPVVVLVNLGPEEAPVEFTNSSPSVTGLTPVFPGQPETIPTTLPSGSYAVYAQE